ncbi:hypothetical protein BH09MYX1_BH09MYX1_51410 [soil metagenome]
MSISALRSLALLGVIVLVHGCSFSDPPPVSDPLASVAEGCDPLVPEHCGYPFPNDYYRSVDGAGKGHLHLAKMLPQPASGTPIDPSIVDRRDGFSPGEEALAFFPNLDFAGLSDEDHIESTLKPDSLTLLVDAETGELVPHFAELDAGTFKEDDEALMIRPVVRLKDAHRYIVAIRQGLKDRDGKPIIARDAFRYLRDGVTTKNADFEARRPHFADIFDHLAKAGIPKDALLLAWDYTTATRESTTSDMLAMRDDALALVGADGPEYTITKIEPAPNSDLAMRLYGTMHVPLYLNDPGPGSHIVRDENGKPKRNGFADYEFLVLVPNSASPDNPAGILQNGHGLLGYKTEGIDGYFAKMCNRHDYVGVAVDWIGMAHEDVPVVTEAATTNLNVFASAVDRQHQGFVNSLLAMRMMMGRMTKDPNLLVKGKPIIDPTRRFYRGDSQGGIFGTTYMAISTDVTRGLVGEPGMPYTLLLDRSVDFGGFKFLLRGAFPNGLDGRLVQALLQILWDRTEPNGYAPYLANDMLPGTPAHRILIHAAIGDHQVTPLGAHLIARTVGAKNLKPVNRSVWGISEADGPIQGESVLVEYDFGLPPAPKVNVPMHEGDDPHGAVRGLDVSQDQADEFFRTGIVKPFCNGPCNPE